MQRTEDSIRAKWEKKRQDIIYKAEVKYRILLENRKKKYERDFEYEIEKNERKKRAYINKKEKEYKRRMNNEIRELKGRAMIQPKKYRNIPNLIEFAARIMQENARLRDSDENGV